MAGMTGTLSKEDTARVREAFLAAGYTADGVLDLLGATANAALARRESVPARRALRAAPPGPLATLVRLFLLGESVPVRDVERALPLEPASRLGLLGISPRDPGEACAELDARPYDEDFYVVSDLGAGLDGAVQPVPSDHVLGVGGASVALTGLTMPGRVNHALDLGTGCGVQALHLSKRASYVVGTDVLPRALELSRIGAALSGVELDLRLGGMYNPVAGERFDLIVSNPPFVIGAEASGPGKARAYRDGGLAGDEFCRRLVSAAPEHLTEGGWCQVLANWAHVHGQSWEERVSAWLPAGCDAWALQREVLDPAAYVSLWLHDAGDVAGPGYPAAYDAWLGALERDGVEAIGFGWIALRRAEVVSPVRRVEDWPHPVESPLGPHIAGHFHRTAWLREYGTEEALAGARVRLADEVQQEQIGRPGAEDPEYLVLRQVRGLRRARRADTATAALVGACDGTLPLGLLVDAVASVLDEDRTELRTRLLREARELVTEGFLEPV
jgi:methylase of polypeptide subunit release factors